MKLTIFIIVVGIIAAINNLIGIIINGPAAIQKLPTPVVIKRISSLKIANLTVLRFTTTTIVLALALRLITLPALAPTLPTDSYSIWISERTGKTYILITDHPEPTRIKSQLLSGDDF